MNREDLCSYLRLLAGLLLTSPLVFLYWRVEFSTLKSLEITACMYFVLMCIAIPMFNYLEYGVFGYWISEETREKYGYPYGKNKRKN